MITKEQRRKCYDSLPEEAKEKLLSAETQDKIETILAEIHLQESEIVIADGLCLDFLMKCITKDELIILLIKEVHIEEGKALQIANQIEEKISNIVSFSNDSSNQPSSDPQLELATHLIEDTQGNSDNSVTLADKPAETPVPPTQGNSSIWISETPQAPQSIPPAPQEKTAIDKIFSQKQHDVPWGVHSEPEKPANPQYGQEQDPYREPLQ